jgi:CubicO group peptidase (beta-lactamase class C family)
MSKPPMRRSAASAPVTTGLRCPGCCALAASALALGTLLAGATGPANAGPARVDLSAERVERWADPTFERAYQQHRFSGLGIVAVQDGRITFVKGYGEADPAVHRPIDASLTRFRVGSISKTFTALAVAILLDEGRIHSLADPANRYLKRAQLPQVAGRDITLWDLLTHRGGFEDKDWVLDPVSVPLTALDVSKYVPRVQAATADLSEYCNACSALLGIVVEDVSGELLQDFLAERVFRPLGMSNALLNTSRSPSVGVGFPYAHGTAGLERVPYMVIPEFFAPAGSVDASLRDMGAYMIANLGGDGAGILSLRAWSTMFTPHAQNHPAVSAYGMVWMIHQWNQVRVIEHGGAIDGYHSIAAMFPDSNAGLFISCFCALGPQAAPPKPGAVFDITGFNIREMIYREFLGVAPVTSFTTARLDEYVSLFEADAPDTTFPRRIARMFRPLGASTGFLEVARTSDALTIGGHGPYRASAADVFRMPDLNQGDVYIPYPNREQIIFMRDSKGSVDRVTLPLSLRTVHRLRMLERPDLLLAIYLAAVVAAAFGTFTFFWRPAADAPRRLPKATLWLNAACAAGSALLCAAIFRWHWLQFAPLSEAQTHLAQLIGAAVALSACSALIASATAVSLWRSSALAAGRTRRWAQLQATVGALGGVVAALLLVSQI